MKVPVQWLRSFGEFSSLDDDHLADILTMAGLEVEEVDGCGAGAVFVTKVTPNRGDWMSVFGVAREASAATGLPLNPLTALESLPVSSTIGSFKVNVEEPELCPRFAVSILHNINVVPSPSFIQDRLVLAGMRPINIIVDITNYVMLELGQPLHAYDLKMLNGAQIVVRLAQPDETLKTLDGADRLLSPGTLVIADAREVLGVAGIMGGAASEVTGSTKSIVLEAAHFDPSTVRRGARSLGLSTEASYRFERSVDPALVPIALTRATELLIQFAGATAEDMLIDTLPQGAGHRSIRLRVERTNKMLGLDLSPSQIEHSLQSLGLSVRSDGDDFVVVVPTFRPDIVQEIDLIEEVGRMIGYQNLPETVPMQAPEGGSDFDQGRFDSKLRSLLVAEGYIEAYSHTLGAVSPFDDPIIAPKRVAVRSSLSSELSGLRLNLLPHLLDALALNLRHNASDIRLFEVGKVFRYNDDGSVDESRHVAGALSGPDISYSNAKGTLENLLSAIGIKHVSFTPARRWAMHSYRCAEINVDGRVVGYVAELSPFEASAHLELPPSTHRISAFELHAEDLRIASSRSAKNVYRAMPRFPAVSRDIALAYDIDVAYGAISSSAMDAGEELVENVSLVSVYTGDRVPDGKKSVAIRLSMRSQTRTLTDDDAERCVSGVRHALINRLNASDR